MKPPNPTLTFFPRTVAATAAIVIAGLISVQPTQATPYVVTLTEVGSDVIANGSGSIDLFGLGFSNGYIDGSRIDPANGVIVTGPFGLPRSNGYTGFSGPTTFGSGSLMYASNGSGDLVGISGSSGLLYVPVGYLNDTALSDSATFGGATFASLGLTPGTYVWTWGTGADQSFTLQIGPAEVPDTGSTLGLLFVSLLALFGVGLFRTQYHSV